VTTKIVSVNRKPDIRTGNTYGSYRMQISSTPLLSPIYEQFVINGTRIIPEILGGFTPLSLAFLIMSNGLVGE